MKKTLDQWLSYLESIHPSEIEMGLNRVRQVAQTLGLIKPTKKVLMIAGTNGKGSTVTLASECLLQSGFTVGQYMSPHLHVYNERVRINGELANDDDLIESFEAIDKARGDITLTYFEVGTLSALYLFKKYQLDVSVLEVGLGGRLDAVNIVDPDVSVVTSIGLDHEDWLGSDISVIAYEKAGIYRADKPAVCGQVNPPEALKQHAHKLGAALFLKGEQFHFEVSENTWAFSAQQLKGSDINWTQLPLPSLPVENAATALQALLLLEPSIKRSAIEKGLLGAQLDGRLQRIPNTFNGFMDVGHNQQAAELLATRLQTKPKGKRHVLLAMLQDKKPQGVVQALGSLVDCWHLAGLEGYRGQSAQELHAKLELPDAKLWTDVNAALVALQQSLSMDDELVILGSFFTVAHAMSWLEANNEVANA